MADTASLIARVKTEGAEQSAKQLDDFATSAGKADTSATKMASSVDKATPKLKGFGTGAQQIGYQVQDMIVQIQGGTSAFVAIGQQGSQLAGAFGPGGAVIGAIIALSAAVGGTLVKSLGGAKVSAEELQASTKTLDDVLQKNKDGTYELSDSFVELANNIDTASQAQAKFYEAQSATVTQTEASKEAITDLVDSLDTWTNGSAIGAQRSLELGQQTSSLTGYIEDLSSKFGITNEEATTLVPLLAAVQKNASPENIKALSDETARLNDKYQGTNGELVKFNGELFKNIGNLQEAASKSDTLSVAQDKLAAATNSTTQRLKEQNAQIIKNVQIGNMADRDRYAAQAEADKAAFAKRQGVTEQDIKDYNAARDEQARQDIQRVNDTEAKKAAAEQKAADNKAAQSAKRAESEAQRQQTAANNFLDTLQRQNQDELAAIDAQEQQKLEKLQSFRDNETITQQQYEEAKTQIALDADAKRNELLQKQTEDRAKQQNSADSFIEQLRAQNEGELAEIDRQNEIKLQKLQDFYDKGLVAEEDYQKARQDIQEETEQKKLDSYVKTLGDTTSALKTALGEGSALYKAAAITQTIIETYKGATAAYASLSTIPIVGPSLGIAAAAAITAAGLANVGKIRSAREQGGNLSAGQISTIAERGKPEVIMPAGASRVRTADQMRQIMGETGNKNNGIPQISIINQTSGRIDSVQQEQDDEGRIRLLIRETVSSDFQDSNSNIAKSRRSSRGQPGMA
ncbi:MAG: SHOCT domain-containing protein [Kluyvera sp.]|uniref:SHOCT domain-containing protein n=1 Tax=Kluyvera sp. TaxID=1538228 RepID=UPI003F2EAED6